MTFFPSMKRHRDSQPVIKIEETFTEYLNQQCSKIAVPLLIICSLIWLPYMENDQKVHPNQELVYWTRVVPTIHNFLLLIISVCFKSVLEKKGLLIMTAMVGMTLITESLTMVSSGFLPVYVSSLYLAILFPLILPLSLKTVCSLLVSSLFLILGYSIIYDLPQNFWEDKEHIIMDLSIAYMFSFVISTLSHRQRYEVYVKSKENFYQKQKLNQLLEEKSQQYESIFKELQENLSQVKIYSSTLKERDYAMKDMVQKHEQEKEDIKGQIADHLHDTLGQNLAVSKLKLDTLIQESFRGNHKSELELRQIFALIQQAVEDTRTTISKLSLEFLEEYGLVKGMQEVTKDISERYDMDVRFCYDHDLPQITKEPSLLLFKSIQELLTNIFKHCDKKIAFVSLRFEAPYFVLTVRDLGPGVTENDLRPKKNGGYGLFRLKSQLESFGGKLLLGAIEEGGEVKVQLPAAPKDQI